jgi:putative membrane protein insertion efficiency factor
MLGKSVITAVKIYRSILSPFLPRCCRYHPTCSAYMIKAVEINGSTLGLIQGICRILRCNPLFPGGGDYPEKIRGKVGKWSREHC